MSRFTQFRDKFYHFVESIFHAFADPLVEAIERNGGDILISAAITAVEAAESAGGSGQDKLDAARKAVENSLRDKGIPVVVNAVNGAIEMAVAKMKALAHQSAAEPSNN